MKWLQIKMDAMIEATICDRWQRKQIVLIESDFPHNDGIDKICEPIILPMLKNKNIKDKSEDFHPNSGVDAT